MSPLPTPDRSPTGPLKVAIMAPRDLDFAFWERRIFEKLATDPRFEIAALIIDARPPRKRRPLVERLTDPRLPANVLAGLAKRLDRAVLPPEPTAPAPTFEALLPTLPRIEVGPERRRFVDRFGEADTARIRDLGLDVILRHAFGIIQGPVLEAARHGIWSFHHGDNTVNRGAPPGYWESARREPATGATLQILTEELDGGRAIARCWRTTEPNAARNQRAIFDLSVSLIWRELQHLAETGAVSSAPSPLYDGPLHLAPRANDSLSYLAKRAGDMLGGVKHRIDGALGRRPMMWQLALGRGPIETAALWRTRPIDPPANRFWADPFLIERDGKTYCFFEEYDYSAGRAWISAGLVEGDELRYLGVAVDAGYHMSFPFVIAHGGEVYMIPETASRRRIEIWRAVDFPLTWQLHKTVMEGTDIADTVLLEHDGAWWMLTNISNALEPDYCNELHVFAIDGPELREVRPHPMNPVVIDAGTARSAGRPFVRDGCLFRPSQANNHGIYGFGWNLMEITALTPKRYDERIAHRIQPNFHRGMIATHHFDKAGDIFVIDICRRLGGRGRWRPDTPAALPEPADPDAPGKAAEKPEVVDPGHGPCPTKSAEIQRHGER